MFISKRLSRKFHKSGATVLLYDGQDKNDCPRIVMRNVEALWGHYEPTGQKGGVCFAPLSDNSTHAAYSAILGYHTGDEASVQELLLKEVIWHSQMPYSEWKPFVYNAAQALLRFREVTNPRLTPELLTSPNFCYRDNWYGDSFEFVRLRDARKQAKTETGVSITIFSCHTGEIVCFTPASGHCPP